MRAPPSLAADMEKLRKLQFRRYEHCHSLVRRLFKLRRTIDRHDQAAQLWHVYQWLLTPRTLWALDYAGIADHLCKDLEARRDFSADVLLLLKVIAPPPPAFSQEQITEYEKVVSKGHYDGLLKQPQKFQECEAEIGSDAVLRNVWNQLKQRFDVAHVAKFQGVIRRTLVQERNFRAFALFRWKTKRDRLRLLLDAVCYKWCLYGFENGKPLLLKVSVNPTPHGTMIVIPRHMSLDGHRDLDWDGIDQLHRAHGARRQGKLLSAGRVEKRVLRQRACELDVEARARNLKGELRYRFILTKMNQDVRRISWLKRLLKSDSASGQPNP